MKNLIGVTGELSIEKSGISAKAVDMQRIINYVKVHQGSSSKEILFALKISTEDFKVLIHQCLLNDFLFKKNNKFYFKKKQL